MTESKRFSREIKRISQNFAVRPNEVIKRNTNDGNLSLTFKSTDFDDKELLISDKSLLVNSTINKKHKSLIVDGAFQLDLNKIDLSIIKLEGDSTLTYVENFDEGKIYQIIVQQNEIGNNNFTIHENLLEHVVLLGDGISLNSEPNSLTIFNLTVVNNIFFIEQENNEYKKVTNNLYGTFSFRIDTTLGSNAGPSFELGLKNRGFDSGQYIKDGQPSDETPYYMELNYDFIVDWGDGQTNHITSWDDINKNHNYSTNGEYQISISGLCEGYGTNSNWWEYNNTTYDQEKIIRIDEIDYIGFKDLYAFMGNANNLTNINNISSNAFKDVINMSYMFNYCSSLTTLDVSNWDVSNVTTMNYMFSNTPLDTPSYDKLLIGWSKLPSLQPNLTFEANLAKYSSGAAADARQYIINTYEWSISDAGQVV